MAPKSTKAKKVPEVNIERKTRGKQKNLEEINEIVKDVDLPEKIVLDVKKRGRNVVDDNVEDVNKRGRGKKALNEVVESHAEETPVSVDKKINSKTSPVSDKKQLNGNGLETNGQADVKTVDKLKSGQKLLNQEINKEDLIVEEKAKLQATRGKRNVKQNKTPDVIEDAATPLEKELESQPIDEKAKQVKGKGKKNQLSNGNGAQTENDDKDVEMKETASVPARGRKKVANKNSSTESVPAVLKGTEESVSEDLETKKNIKAKRTQAKKTQPMEELEDAPSDVKEIEEPATKKRKIRGVKAAATKDDIKDIDEPVMNDDNVDEPETEDVAMDSGDEVKESDEPSNKKRRKAADIKAPAAVEPKKKKELKNKAATSYEDIDFSNTSMNEKGKPWNLKVSCWNVDGIRAWLTKGGLDYIKYEKPDILCLQEIKCSQDKLPSEIASIPGYHPYWLCSDKDGYAGVGIYTTKMAINVQYGLKDEELDSEGRIITAEYEQFYLITTYVPNAGRKLVTLPKRLKWNEAFHQYVKELDKKKPVIICGDMNVAHEEKDLANPKANKKNAGFTAEEREGMTKLLGDGFVDTFRHFNPDKTAAYTFWTYMMNCRAKNVGWRLDYFIVSERLMPMVCDSVIRDGVYGSDHCPITMFLHLSSVAKIPPE